MNYVDGGQMLPNTYEVNHLDDLITNVFPVDLTLEDLVDLETIALYEAGRLQ
jgi:hypothetical protein